MQQDAHEFLNFLINHISEIITGFLKEFILYYWMLAYIFYFFASWAASDK